MTTESITIRDFVNENLDEIKNSGIRNQTDENRLRNLYESTKLIIESTGFAFAEFPSWKELRGNHE